MTQTVLPTKPVIKVIWASCHNGIINPAGETTCDVGLDPQSIVVKFESNGQKQSGTLHPEVIIGTVDDIVEEFRHRLTRITEKMHGTMFDGNPKP